PIAGKKRRELSFIVDAGTIGEEAAVESLKRGATDYVFKDRLSRLAASVKRAVEQAQARVDRRQGEERIREQAALLDKARDAICVTDMEQRILYWNKGAERLYGWSAQEAVCQNVNDLLVPGGSTRPLEALQELIPRDEWQGE